MVTVGVKRLTALGHDESQKSLGSSDPGNRFNLHIFKMAATENFTQTFFNGCFECFLTPINILATDTRVVYTLTFCVHGATAAAK